MNMAQRLILPINNCRITSGYKNSNYKRQFGYTHYGVDMTDKNRKTLTVWASGVGEVKLTGWSNSGGNVVIVVYKDCLLTDGTVKDLTIRYYHLDSISVKSGQKVTKDTKLGNYGNTGASAGAHLHLEIDVDTKYYQYTPQISRDNGVLKKGVDSTIDPITCLYIKGTAPDNQSISIASYNTISSKDLNYKRY